MKEGGELTEIQFNPPKTRKCKISSECRHALMSMHWFYACGFGISHISTLTQIFLDLRTTDIPCDLIQLHKPSEVFNTLTFPPSECCRGVCHLQRFYYVFTHHTSLHLQIFDTSYPHTTTHPKNLCRHAYKYPIAFPKLQVHCPTSPNILPFQSMLTPDIRYYSHTPCRLLIGSSKTFGPSSFCFLSTPNMIGMHHRRFLLCKNTHRHTLRHLSTPITPASLFAPFEV